MAEVKPDPKQSPRLVRTSYFRTSYANTFRIRVGSDDIGIVFGYQTELPSQSIIQDESEIVVTPKVLKFLSLAIAQTIDQLEAVLGKIELPPPALEFLAKVKEQQEKDTAEAKSKVQAEAKG